MTADTIVAISTPRGAAARGVIRLSGDRARECVDAWFLPMGGQRSAAEVPRGVSQGRFKLGRSRTAAECLVVVAKGPRSFTGEDVVELHLVGAPLLLEVAQELLVRAGARPAEPGEFTRRAYLNGRIDLTRAEAVLALIRAQDDEERRAALALLDGGLERRCAVIRDRVLRALVPLELGLDFSDQDIDIPVPEAAVRGLDRAAAELAELASEGTERAAARHCYRVVLEGPANAGKSSLFNNLLGESAALVTEVAGTTRDVLTGELELGGLRVELVDTAGHDVEAGLPDAEAHASRRRRLREADLVIEVRDVRQADGDRSAVFADRAGDVVAPRRRVWTHADLLSDGARPETATGDVLVSNVSHVGLDALRTAIVDALHAAASSDASRSVQVNARQASGFRAAHRLLDAARHAYANGDDAECVASDLHAVLHELRDVTGEASGDELLDRVFSDFCIGK